MNIDQNDPAALDLVREIFPNVEIRAYTVWHRLGRLWARFQHRFGNHDDVWTYRIGVDMADRFEEMSLVIGKPLNPAAVIVKQLECSVCHRKTGPIHVVEAQEEV